jgi:hypothetical protein
MEKFRRIGVRMILDCTEMRGAALIAERLSRWKSMLNA